MPGTKTTPVDEIPAGKLSETDTDEGISEFDGQTWQPRGARELSASEQDYVFDDRSGVEDYDSASGNSNKPRQLVGLPIIISRIRTIPTQNGDAAIISYEPHPYRDGTIPEILEDRTVLPEHPDHFVEVLPTFIVKADSPIASRVRAAFEGNGGKRFRCKIGVRESKTLKDRRAGTHRTYFDLYSVTEELPDLPIPTFGG